MTQRRDKFFKGSSAALVKAGVNFKSVLLAGGLFYDNALVYVVAVNISRSYNADNGIFSCIYSIVAVLVGGKFFAVCLNAFYKVNARGCYGKFGFLCGDFIAADTI